MISRRGTLNTLTVAGHRLYVPSTSAIGVKDWRPEWCVGQLKLDGCKADLGLPNMTPAEAKDAGCGTLIVGIANRRYGANIQNAAAIFTTLEPTAMEMTWLACPVVSGSSAIGQSFRRQDAPAYPGSHVHP